MTPKQEPEVLPIQSDVAASNRTRCASSDNRPGVQRAAIVLCSRPPEGSAVGMEPDGSNATGGGLARSAKPKRLAEEWRVQRGPGVRARMLPELMGLHSTPAREFVKKSAVKVTGYFASMKSEAMIQWESSLERDFLAVAEIMPGVVSVASQPMTIRFRFNGQPRKYTPDYLVTTRRQGDSVVEVKPARIARELKWQMVFPIYERYFAEQGLQYRVVTEEWIRRQPRLANAKLLLRRRHTDIPADICAQVYALLAGGVVMKIAEILDELDADTPLPRLRDYLHALILNRLLGFDVHQPLSDNTLVHLPVGGGQG